MTWRFPFQQLLPYFTKMYFFPWIAPLYPWYVPYNAKSYIWRYQVQFLGSLVWIDLGLNPELWAIDKHSTHRPMSWPCYFVFQVLPCSFKGLMEVLIDDGFSKTKFCWQCTCVLCCCSTILSKPSYPIKEGLPEFGLSSRLVSISLKYQNQFCAIQSLTIPNSST